MLEFLKDIDAQLFIFLNGQNNSFWDVVMYWISKKYTWIPLYGFLLYLIIRHFQWKSIFVILGIVLLIFLSDQISVFIKNYFERLRPSHEPSLEGMVHLIKGKKGGQFGFVSSHAANSFAIAVFSLLIFKKRIKYFAIYALTWAAIVAYSRVYLGVHYPGDILCGALLGALLGWGIYKIIDRSVQLKLND